MKLSKYLCDAYRETLINKLANENLVNNDNDFQGFCNISLETFNMHATCKKKHVFGDQMSLLYIELLNAIMVRTKLHKIFLQKRTEENRMRYTKQINFSIFLMKNKKGDIMKI